MPLDNFVVLDLETTGLSKSYDKITEIAAVKVSKGKVIDEFHSLVNPEQRIPSFITRLTGITNEMVSDAPKINQILPKFMSFVSDSPIVAHNASFDHGFISFNCEKHLKKSFENRKLCTRKLASRLLPDLSSKKLSCVCEHFKIKNSNAHRAMSDVVATKEVFLNFLDMCKDYGITDEKQLFKFENMSAAKCRKLYSVLKI